MRKMKDGETNFPKGSNKQMDSLANDFSNMNNMGMMNNGFPGPGPMTTPPITEESDHNIIDGEATIITDENNLPTEVEPKKYDRLITNITPLSLTQKKDEATVVIMYLCKDEDEKLFILTRNFAVDDKGDVSIIENLPLYDENCFANVKAVSGLLYQSLERYITDFDYTVESDYARSDNPIITFSAKNIADKNNATLAFGAEQFAAVAYIESYIFEGIYNEHDLALATFTGAAIAYEDYYTPTKFYQIEAIEEVVAMAPAVPKEKNPIKHLKKKKETTSIAVVIRVSRNILVDGNLDKQYNFLLIPFDTDTKYKASKFQGKTSDDILKNFYGDADQFVTTLMMDNIRLLGVDKEYMIIRGKSKNGERFLFLFDQYLMEKLEKMVEEF